MQNMWKKGGMDNSILAIIQKLPPLLNLNPQLQVQHGVLIYANFFLEIFGYPSYVLSN